jgi:very-short-patch-repair endonuclease
VRAEYDGADHRTRHRHERDLARHNALRTLGWVVIQVDAAQLRHPGRVVATVSRTRGVEPGPA